MTITELLDRVDWKLMELKDNGYGLLSIRQMVDGATSCPIKVVLGGYNHEAADTAARHGMLYDDASLIMAAADDHLDDPAAATLRADMLARMARARTPKEAT